MQTNKSQTIKVIGFDLDETLWPLTNTITIATQKTQAFLLQSVPALSNASLKLENKQQQKEIECRYEHNITKRRLHLMQALLVEAGVEHQSSLDISQKALDIFLNYRHQLNYFDGVLDGLKELKKNFSLASISNGNASISRLDDLNELFDFYINAEDINSSKPAPLLFTKTLEHFNCQPSQMIYVGDSLEHDVFAAEAIDMQSIWMNWHQREPNHPLVKHEANDFNDVLRIINQIEAS